MNDLLEEVIEAHGGLERWSQLGQVSAHLVQGGELWELKGQAGVIDEVSVTVSLHEERVRFSPFGADRQSSFTPERVTIENTRSVTIDALDQPRDSFAGHWPETRWSVVQLGYFAGTVAWTHLTQPFALAMPGFVTSELSPWEEHGQRWRRLLVAWPDYLATHSAQQTLYVGADGLLARHDYDIDIVASTAVAHYVSDYVEVAGIKVPSTHRVFPRTPDGEALDAPLLLSIALTEITFT